jgi:NADPH:quinone reductase-like Zn-dependent oxidoreductase
MTPITAKQWKVTRTDKSFDGLEFEEAPILKLTENEVLVKLHAVSLNYRDLMISKAVLYSQAGVDRSPFTDCMSRESIHFLWTYRSFLALMALVKL